MLKFKIIYIDIYRTVAKIYHVVIDHENIGIISDLETSQYANSLARNQIEQALY